MLVRDVDGLTVDPLDVLHHRSVSSSQHRGWPIGGETEPPQYRDVLDHLGDELVRSVVGRDVDGEYVNPVQAIVRPTRRAPSLELGRGHRA